MGKRKEQVQEEIEEEDVVNVDFDFFDLVEDDFLSVKNLIRQLLGLDSTYFNLSSLAQLVVDSKVGTAIKADDEEYNDALALMSTTDFSISSGETQKLFEYYINRCNHEINGSNGKQAAQVLRALRTLETNNKKVGLLVSERMLNMPFEVVPPLYQILSQEYTENGLDYEYLLVPSRFYSERASSLEGNVTATDDEFFAFHPEDPFINKHAAAHFRFAFQTPIDETDSRRAFQDNGIYPYGHLAIIETSKLPEIAATVAGILN